MRPRWREYAAEGVRTVLVCCTGGEAGDILNEAADTRRSPVPISARCGCRELDESVRIIGYDKLYLSATATSGMPDTDDNAHPDNFRQRTDLDEAVGRLVASSATERPQVIVTYRDGRGGGYAHPDHIRVHEISVLAFDRAGDPDGYPDAGDPGSR